MSGEYRRLSFQGGATIEQGNDRIEVTAVLYANEEAPASSFSGTYELFDHTPRPQPGPVVIRFSSGDEADALITEAGPSSGRFEISEHLRPLPGYFAKPS